MIDKERYSDILSQKKECTKKLKDKYPDFIENESFKTKLEEKLQEVCDSLPKHLDKNNPTNREVYEYCTREKNFFKTDTSTSSINQDLEYLKKYDDLETDYWTNKLNGPNSNLPQEELNILHSNLQRAWKDNLENRSNKWEKQEIKSKFQNVQIELEEWLSNCKEIQDSLNGTGLENYIDFGELSQGDLKTIKEWAEIIKSNKSIKKILDLLGRLRSANQNERFEKIIQSKTYHGTKIDINSKEEPIGIKFGKDLETILPQELALLCDPETSILFDLKYIENRLMCFERQGYMSYEWSESERIQISVEEEDNMGPIILCIDTSGSMMGEPEIVAKATALFLAMNAKEQKRSCYLIEFSSQIVTLDLTPPKGFSDLMNFINSSFNGGTDLEPALSHAVKVLNTNTYEKADVLLISDGGIPPISDILRKQCLIQKQKETKFYTLIISNRQYSQQGDIWDKEFLYQNNGTIQEICHSTTRR